MANDTTATGSQRVAVIGPGKVGSQLVRGFARAGHHVTVGARDAAKASELTALARVEVLDPGGAAAAADVVVLAVPVRALAEALEGLGDLSGKVLVDATNAVSDACVLAVEGYETVSDYIAERAPGAAVVKAFNTIGSEHLADGTIGGHAVFLPVAGDDRGRAAVVALAESLGFDVADLGGRDAVTIVENAARLWIHLAFRCGWGREFGFGVLRP